MSVIKREDLIDRLSKESGYFKKDLRVVFKCLDTVIVDCFDEVTPDNAVQIQLLNNFRLTGKWIPERQRVDPRNQEPIICAPTVKIGTIIGDGFRNQIQQQCDEKQKDN